MLRLDKFLPFIFVFISVTMDHAYSSCGTKTAALNHQSLNVKKFSGAKSFDCGQIWTPGQATQIRAIIKSSRLRNSRHGEASLLSFYGGEFRISFFKRSRLHKNGFTITREGIRNLDFSPLESALSKDLVAPLIQFVYSMAQDFSRTARDADHIHLALRIETYGGFYEGHSHGKGDIQYLKREVGKHTEVRSDGKSDKPEIDSRYIEIPAGEVLVLADAWHRTPRMPRLEDRLIVLLGFDKVRVRRN